MKLKITLFYLLIHYHSLSFVAARCTTLCHSLPPIEPLVFTPCHLWLLDIPLECLKLTPETFNKFHVSKNFLCVDCAFKNLPLYQRSDSSDQYSTETKSSFPSNDQLKLFNNCNSLKIIRNNEEDIKLFQSTLRLKNFSIYTLFL